jgi:hypothetical protein
MQYLRLLLKLPLMLIVSLMNLLMLMLRLRWLLLPPNILLLLLLLSLLWPPLAMPWLLLPLRPVTLLLLKLIWQRRRLQCLDMMALPLVFPLPNLLLRSKLPLLCQLLLLCVQPVLLLLHWLQ